MLRVRCQAGKTNRESGSGSGFGIEWIAVVFDTDSDGDGELRKKSNRKTGVGFRGQQSSDERDTGIHLLPFLAWMSVLL